MAISTTHSRSTAGAWASWSATYRATGATRSRRPRRSGTWFAPTSRPGSARARRSRSRATVVAAVHDASAGTLSYATAGHPPPIVIGPGAHRPLTVASSPPLGIGSPTGLRQTILPLGPGSTVCLFTDGLIECRTHSGAGFGAERLERVLRELGPQADARTLIDRVDRECEALRDDVAVCLLHLNADAAASTVRVEEIEVTPADLDGPRLRRFLESCGFGQADIDEVMHTARPSVVERGSVTLRVRLADGRSGIDVLPAERRSRSAFYANRNIRTTSA